MDFHRQQVAPFLEEGAVDVEWIQALAVIPGRAPILFGIGIFRVMDNRRQKRRVLQYKDSSLTFVECSLLNINHRIWLTYAKRHISPKSEVALLRGQHCHWGGLIRRRFDQ